MHSDGNRKQNKRTWKKIFANNKTSAEQVWIWVLAPFAGGAIAPFLYSFFFGKKEDKAEDPSSNLETAKEEE